VSRSIPDANRQRVLLLLPTSRDAELTDEVLVRNSIASFVCANAAQLQEELGKGAGAVMIGEECLAAGGAPMLSAMLEAQPRWSDLPVLVFTRSGANSVEAGDAVAMLGNVTLLERPLRVAALVSTVRAALRARHRQYEIESYLREIEQARDAEALAVQRKNEFLAMLAHELRNPLAPIRNALYVLSADDNDPARRASLRDMMMRQVDHMVRLVDDLLEASRLSRGMITLHREPMDLRDALHSAVEQSRPLIDAGRYTLRVDLPDAPVRIDADPVRIAQVLGNLLNNAAKYGRPDGHISICLRREEDFAVVRVDDDGIGIDGDMLSQVFELFIQGERATHGVQEGLGIGLALVQTLVKLHGGTVTAQSEGKQRGARFEVRLPLADARATGNFSGSVAPPPPVVVAASGFRVLVVDDNVDAANSLVMVLDALGIERRVAHDGPTGLQLARSFDPHVMLLDIGMAGMDGYEVARRIRGTRQHDNLVMVAVTGWSHEPDRQRSRAAGFDFHYAKPIDIGELVALLDRLRAQPSRSGGLPSGAHNGVDFVHHGE
jgi:signal transduction histidine kinase/ActR/RegA family two-component response regulator